MGKKANTTTIASYILDEKHVLATEKNHVPRYPFSTNLCATNIETREDAIQSSIVAALLYHPLLCCKGTVAETKEGTILYRGHCLVASVAMSNRTQEALGEGLEPDTEWTRATVSMIGTPISCLRYGGWY